MLVIYTLQDHCVDNMRWKMSRCLRHSRCLMNFSCYVLGAKCKYFLLQEGENKTSLLVRMQQQVLGTNATTSGERATHPQSHTHL